MSKILYTLTLFILLSITGFSQNPGELDPSFNGTGIIKMDISGGSETSHGIAVQPDHKIVVSMAADFDPASLSFDFAVMRFHENGLVDSTFGVNGVFHYENTLGSDIPYNLRLNADGTLFVTGSYSQTPNNTEFMVIKLLGDGSLDSSFATNGVLIQPINVGQDYGRGLTLDASGNLIVCGYSHTPGFNYRHNVLCRFSSAGVLDSTFATNGIFEWNDNQTTNEMYNVAVAADGNYLVSGYAKPSSKDRPALYKVLSNGSGLDISFGDNGEAIAPIEGRAYGMAILANGTIMLGGYTANSVTGNNMAVLAYNPDGTPDLAFGVNGLAEADADLLDYGFDIFLQSDGKILLTGEAGAGFMGAPRRFLTARFLPDGQVDSTWGGNGTVETPTSTFFAFSNSVTVQPHDGKVVITGASATSTTGNDLTIVRYGNFVDADGDGYGLGDDCNDDVAAVNPGETETPYNGIDDDCNPATPDDDLDGDGFPLATDCDDTNATVNPDATETPYNGFDDDCNASTPDDDLDGDGFLLAEDCDDNNAAINPNAAEIPANGIDENCDGMDDPSAVHESLLAQLFSVYPNPASDIIVIAPGSGAPAIERVSVVDCTGRLVLLAQTPMQNGQLNLAISDLPQGVFFVNILTGEGQAVKRVVKQ